MKSTIIALVVLFCLPLHGFAKGDLLNHAMPIIPNKTLDGRTINADYYKGHITIVNFMFIGCYPCMMEISVLNRLSEEYAGNKQIQFLTVARQMSDQMEHFNADDTTIYSIIRKTLKVDPIKYTIQPSCGDGESKWIISDHIEAKSECNTIADNFGIEAFPTIFYVDKEGIIRKIKTGGSSKQDDPNTYNEIKMELETLIKK